jgi:hypothetical protein
MKHDESDWFKRYWWLRFERDAEVAELRAVVEEALGEVSDHGSALEPMGFIKRQGAEIVGLKELLRRAAEALACCNLDHLQDDLIAEVRQAAGGGKER